MQDAGSILTPETLTTPPTPTVGSTEASPEAPAPAPTVPATTGRRNGKFYKRPWVETKLSRRQLEFLESCGINTKIYSMSALDAFWRAQSFFSKKVAVGFTSLVGTTSIQLCLDTQSWARELLKNPNLPTELKLEAAKIVADEGKTLEKLLKRVVDNADKGEAKVPMDQPMNKPPNITVPVQVNVSQGPPNSASNGSGSITTTSTPPE